LRSRSSRTRAATRTTIALTLITTSRDVLKRESLVARTE
jgi:hypothetical protein